MPTKGSIPTKGPTTCHANKRAHHLSCQQNGPPLVMPTKGSPLVIPTKVPTTCHTNKMGPPLVIPTKWAHHLSFQQMGPPLVIPTKGPTTCHTNKMGLPLVIPTRTSLFVAKGHSACLLLLLFIIPDVFNMSY